MIGAVLLFPLHHFITWIGTASFLLVFKRYAFIYVSFESQQNRTGPRQSSPADSTLMREHDTTVYKLPRISGRL